MDPAHHFGGFINQHADLSTPTSGWDWKALRATALRECRAVLGDSQDAEDAAQQALIRAWRFASRCRSPGRPEPWVRAIARREALRLMARRPAPHSNLEDAGVVGDDDHAECVERRADVVEALGRLDEQDRRLLLMQYWQERTCSETAAELGMPVGTVKIRLHRSRKRLADLLGEAR
jgi:RNA polymerase sigma-70 factor (ECF subfamily)